MPRRVVLRNFWTHGCYRFLCSELILCSIFDCVFKLFIGDLFVICIYHELLKL